MMMAATAAAATVASRPSLARRRRRRRRSRGRRPPRTVSGGSSEPNDASLSRFVSPHRREARGRLCPPRRRAAVVRIEELNSRGENALLRIDSIRI